MSELTDNLKCPMCGAPAIYCYQGSSDHTFTCSAPADVCGASVNIWVKRSLGELEEAVRRYTNRPPTP